MLERIHLAIIREVDRSGSLTSAAQSLHLTQSALSHAIKKIEHQLQTPLWTREGRGLKLTQAGLYLLDLANRLLPQFEHGEVVMQQFAQGNRGLLRIGMECHPCYQWLQTIVAPYLVQWPHVDLDVKQKFQFGGLAALLGYEIDMLVTPDPVLESRLQFEPVFDYEQVLVVGRNHPLSGRAYVEPEDLSEETLITYPVPIERLDIYREFFMPARRAPKEHKTIEATEIMLQMVASQRGVAALPGWLIAEYSQKIPLYSLRLGPNGIHKQIFLGVRQNERASPYIQAFFELASTALLR